MTQEVFPEISAAAEALEKRIAITEAEVEQLKGEIAVKKKLIKGWRKAVNAVKPEASKERQPA